jgi:hypothetical protein
MEVYLTHLWHLILRGLHASTVLMGTTLLAIALGVFRYWAVPWIETRTRGGGQPETGIKPRLSASVKLTVLTWLSLFGVSVVKVVYQDHQSLVARNATLEKQISTLQHELDDRRYNLKLADPATGRMFAVIKAFSLYRHRIGAQASCKIEITSPRESFETAMNVGQLAWVGTLCPVFGPMDTSADPDVEMRATIGMQNDLVVFHMAKNESADTLYMDLGSILRLKRSYELPSGSPPNLLWLQFGTGKQWNIQ